MSQAESLRIQYDSKFEVDAYLLYFSDVSLVEEYFLRNLKDAFESGKVKGDRILDFSCGPVPHRMGLASKYCKEVTFSDFSSQNRQAIEKFLTSEDLVPIHQYLFQHVAKLEGFEDVEEGSKLIVERTKSKSTGVILSDIHNSSLLTPAQPLFDIVYSGAVLEAACPDHQSFVVAVKNIAGLLKPGGFYACSGFLEGDYYVVGQERFPCLNFDAPFVEKSFAEAGFEDIVINSQTPETVSSPPDTSLSNCKGIFFVTARKPE